MIIFCVVIVSYDFRIWSYEIRVLFVGASVLYDLTFAKVQLLLRIPIAHHLAFPEFEIIGGSPLILIPINNLRYLILEQKIEFFIKLIPHPLIVNLRRSSETIGLPNIKFIVVVL